MEIVLPCIIQRLRERDHRSYFRDVKKTEGKEYQKGKIILCDFPNPFPSHGRTQFHQLSGAKAIQP